MPVETLDLADIQPLALSDIRPSKSQALDLSDIEPLDLADIESGPAPTVQVNLEPPPAGTQFKKATTSHIQRAMQPVSPAIPFAEKQKLVPETGGLSTPKEFGRGIVSGFYGSFESLAALANRASGQQDVQVGNLMRQGYTRAEALAQVRGIYRQATAEIAGEQPESTAGKVGSGIGSALGFMTTAPFGAPAMTAQAAALGIDEAMTNLDQTDPDLTKAQRAGVAAIGGIIGATDSPFFGGIYGRLKKIAGLENLTKEGLKEILYPSLAKVAKDLGKDMAVEGGQEAFQSLAQDVLQYSYGGKRADEIGKTAVEEGLYGAVVGALFGGATQLATTAVGRRQLRDAGIDPADVLRAQASAVAAEEAAPAETAEGYAVLRRYTPRSGVEMVEYQTPDGRRGRTSAENFAAMVAPEEKAAPKALDIEEIAPPGPVPVEAPPVAGPDLQPEDKPYEGVFMPSTTPSGYEPITLEEEESTRVPEISPTEAAAPAETIPPAEPTEESPVTPTEPTEQAAAPETEEESADVEPPPPQPVDVGAEPSAVPVVPEAASVGVPGERAEPAVPEVRAADRDQAGEEEKAAEPVAKSVQKNVDWQESKKPEVAESLDVGSTRVLKKGDTVHREKLVEVNPAELVPNPENKMYPEKVAEYVKEPGPIPIEVREMPEGGYLIHEGHHRVAAAVERGEKTIRAWVPVNEPVEKKVQSKAALEAEREILAEPEPQTFKAGDEVEWTAQGKPYRGTVEGRTERQGSDGKYFTVEVRQPGKKGLTTLNEKMKGLVAARPAAETKPAEPETKPVPRETKAQELKNQFAGAVQTEHLTDEQIDQVADIFDKAEKRSTRGPDLAAVETKVVASERKLTDARKRAEDLKALASEAELTEDQEDLLQKEYAHLSESRKADEIESDLAVALEDLADAEAAHEKVMRAAAKENPMLAEQPSGKRTAKGVESPQEVKADERTGKEQVRRPEVGVRSESEPVRAEDTPALDGIPPEDGGRPSAEPSPESVGVRSSAEDGGPTSESPAGEQPAVRSGKRTRVPGVVSPAGREGAAQPDLRSGDTPAGNLDRDYSITAEQAEAAEYGGARTKARNNLEAIRTIKKIQAENNRPATPEEQAAIAKYVGWGDSELANGIFGGKSEWAGIREELRNLLADEEFEAARDSTINAHYTRRDIARAMWDAAVRMGFRAGGTAIEPGMGIGNFFMTMPEDLKPGTSRTGVEMDLMTGNMARALYPGSNIVIKPYQETSLPQGYFDLAIGNVPFASHQVNDPEFRRTPQLTQNVHNYFFAKTMNRLRPGGVMMAITSRYTMDGQDGKAFRKWMNEQAELLGAIRLPRDTFKANAGTSVTVDVLFLRKRLPEGRAVGSDPAWIDSTQVTTKDGTELHLNEYFQQHPEMMMGEMGAGTQYRRGYPELLGKFSLDQFRTMMEDALPGDVIPAWATSATQQMGDLVEAYPDASFIKDGQYVIKDGALVQREGAYFKPVTLTGKRLERMRGLIGLRDAAREVVRTQALDMSEKEILEARANLNKAYDQFTQKYGAVNTRGNILVFADDPDWPLLSALEDYDKKAEKAVKRQIFTERTIQKPKPVDRTDTGAEALAISLNELGRLDWDRMQQLTGRTPEELQKEMRGIIYQDPISRRWETADEYLSGNVRKKLEDAEFAAKNDPRYEANVEALKQVQPVDKQPGQIYARLGANWIPDRYFDDFLREEFQAEGKKFVNYIPATGSYGITLPTNFEDAGATAMQYTTPYFYGMELFGMAMNGQTPIAYDTYETPEGNERRVKNADATIEANEKMRAIQQKFIDWVWRDVARTDALAAKYNKERNNIRLREYDGSHLTFPGLNRTWLRNQTPDPHQKNAVWRIIQNGNTLLAHAVGAGKTLEMIMAIMELRRLGMARKPMIVVPNHLVGQWKDNFLTAYPAAQLLVPTKKDFEKKNRKKLMARIATGNYDAVVVGMNSFEKLPVKPETYQEFIDEQLSEIQDALDAASAGKSKKDAYNDPTVKQLVRRKAALEAKLEKRLAKDKKDDAMFFEELGVDQLFVDEAHMFKNLGYMTMMDRVAGLPNSDANRSTDMFLKTQYVSKLHGGSRGVVFATGTPVSNSIAELWTMMRYLMLPYLTQEHLDQFDAWAKTYGNTVTKIEVAPEGGRFIPRTRFADFVNLASLQNLFRTVADVKTKEQLNLPVPAVYKGGPIDVISQPTEELKEYVKQIGERADAIRAGEVEPDEDNMLKISSDGRKASLDMRLVDPLAKEDPNSKANKAIANILENYREFNEHRAAQLVFLDLSTPKSEKSSKKKAATADEIANVDVVPAPTEEVAAEQVYGEKEEEEAEVETAEEEKERFTVYSQIKKKLIAGGIPADQIAFIHDAKTDDQKQALFDKVNDGDVRVLLGSTEKMGAGMNVQRRLVAIHHLDSPWRPSDLEQRDGRIERQGNILWDKYQIPIRKYRYSTEGSFDAFMWETVVSKARPIEAFMNGDPSLDKIEELSPVVLSYEQIKANSSGSPLIREKILLDNDINKWEVMRGSWMTEQSNIRRNLAGLPGQIEAKEELISDLETDIKTRDANKALVVGGKEYTEADIRKDGAAALVKMLEKLGPVDKLTPIDATYRGFKLQATPEETRIGGIISPTGNAYTRERSKDGKWLYSGIKVKDGVSTAKTVFPDDFKLVPLSKSDAAEVHEAWEQPSKEFAKAGYKWGEMRVWARPELRLTTKAHTFRISVNYDTPAGTIASADHQIKGFEEEKNSATAELGRLKKSVVELEGRAGEPFKYEEKLRDGLKRQAELARELGENTDDVQALAAMEDEDKNPLAPLMKDPTTAMYAKWFPKKKYFVARGRGKESVSGYWITKELAVREVKTARGLDNYWTLDHLPSGTNIGFRFPNDFQAVAFTRQIGREMDWKVDEVTTALRDKASEIYGSFTPPKETPEQSVERKKKEKEEADAKRAAELMEKSKQAKRKLEPSQIGVPLNLGGPVRRDPSEAGSAAFDFISGGLARAIDTFRKPSLDDHALSRISGTSSAGAQVAKLLRDAFNQGNTEERRTIVAAVEKIKGFSIDELRNLEDALLDEEVEAGLPVWEAYDAIKPLLPDIGEPSPEPIRPVAAGGGVVKGSRLAMKVEAQAVANKLTTGFAGLPEYQTVNIRQQAERAEALLASDPDTAIRIAMGQELPPAGLLPESVFVAVENDATENKDVDLIRRLATVSTLSMQATGMGQRIRMLGERNQNSPVAAIQSIVEVREQAAERRQGKGAKQRLTKQIKEEVAKANTPFNWSAFIDEIEC